MDARATPRSSAAVRTHPQRRRRRPRHLRRTSRYARCSFASLVAFEPTCPGPPGEPRAPSEPLPALVERLFRRTKAVPLLFRAELASGQLPPELVLGVDQFADPGHDVLVVHVHKVCRPGSGVRWGLCVMPNGRVLRLTR